MIVKKDMRSTLFFLFSEAVMYQCESSLCFVLMWNVYASVTELCDFRNVEKFNAQSFLFFEQFLAAYCIGFRGY